MLDRIFLTRKLMELIQKYLDKESQGKWKLFFHLELQAFEGTAVLTGYLSTQDTQNTLNLQESFISETLAIDRPLWCFPFTGTWVITHQLNPIPQIIYKHCKNKCSGHLKAPYMYSYRPPLLLGC